MRIGNLDKKERVVPRGLGIQGAGETEQKTEAGQNQPAGSARLYFEM
jgi:hypothetical protein